MAVYALLYLQLYIHFHYLFFKKHVYIFILESFYMYLIVNDHVK